MLYSGARLSLDLLGDEPNMLITYNTPPHINYPKSVSLYHVRI